MARGWRVQLLPGIPRGIDGVKVDTGRRYAVPRLCPQCKATEETKLLHLDLDADDSRIVSDGVAEELEQCGAIGTVFDVTNEVAGPPHMTFSLGTAPAQDFLLVGAE
jgi:hypothetical protein